MLIQSEIRETVKIIVSEDVPLQYYTGNMISVKIKVAGDLVQIWNTRNRLPSMDGSLFLQVNGYSGEDSLMSFR